MLMSSPQVTGMSGIPPPVRRAPAPRKLSAGHGVSWWSEAWSIFKAAPGVWIGIVIVLFIILFVLAVIPIIGSIAQTFLVPVFAGGVMLGCHALARGEQLRFSHLFAGFQSGRLAPLLILGLLMLGAGIVFAIVMFAVVAATVGMSAFSVLMSGADPTQLGSLSLGSIGIGMFLVVALGVVGGALIAMAYWFAPALIVLNGEDAIGAIRKSFSASLTNFGAFLVYGLLYIALAIVATIPFGLGWLALGPMLAGSCYAAWREIFGE
jgi:uncharacterized membrane protein